MRGRRPKPTALRQRRNRVPGAARLVVDPGLEVRFDLPAARADGAAWHRLTRVWWASVGQSPMAGEMLPVDVHGLVMLAELVDRFHRTPSGALAAEIRLQRACFGLSPMDRTRLRLELGRQAGTTRLAPVTSAATADPRQWLCPVPDPAR